MLQETKLRGQWASQASLWRRWFTPETPLFGTGIVVSAIICILGGVVIWSTFLRGLPGVDATFSLSNYTDVILYPLTWRAALNTLGVATGTVLVSTFFAIPMAWLIHRTNISGKQFFVTMILLQVLLPGFLMTMGWIILAAPQRGIINQFLRLFIPVETGPLSIYNIHSIALLQGMMLTPSSFLMVAGAFVSIDASYEEAAEVSGVSKLKTLRRITLPLVKTPVVAAAIYNFMIAVSMFEVAALLGTPRHIQVFSTMMYTYVNPPFGLPNFGIAGVYGIFLMVPSFFALVYYQKMLRASHRFAAVTGKGYRPKLTNLGGWKWAGVGFIMFYLLLQVILPLLAVLWTSFVPSISIPSLANLGTMNINGYRSAFSILSRADVIRNTAEMVILVALLSTFISLVFSWIVLRSRMRGRYAMDIISMSPLSIPSIAFAFSVAFVGLLFVKTIPFYGSLASIIVAECIRRIPFGTRTISGSLIQIHKELEEAVQVAGASPIIAIRKVIIPLITPAIFYSFVWAMLTCYREVTIALFLQTPRNIVMSTAIWQRWQAGDSAGAAAMGVIMISVMAVIMLVLLHFFPQILGGRRRV